MTNTSSTRRVATIALAWALLAMGAAAQVPVGQVELMRSDGKAGDLFGIGGSAFGFGEEGQGVAIDGDIVIVGSPLASVGAQQYAGVATIFRRSALGWSEEQTITAVNGEAGDRFGVAVDVSGDRAVVGAPWDTVNGYPLRGSARVFHRDGANWNQVKQLSAGKKFAEFGSAVAIDGDVIVIGAPFDSTVDASQGSATVYRWSGTDWLKEQKLVPSSASAGDSLGWSVAVAVDLIAVVSAFDVSGGGAGAGSVAVFRWNGTAWVEQQVLHPTLDPMPGGFGMGVDLDGDVMVVGDPYSSVSGIAYSGAATVFRRHGSAWLEEQLLIGGASSITFGNAVSVDGDLIAVGEPYAAPSHAGGATVFRWDGANWGVVAPLLGSDTATGDEFGSSVAIAGDTVVVGAGRHDVGSNIDQGAAYVFDLYPDPWTNQGGALAGLVGKPILEGSGTLLGGDDVTLLLFNAAPLALAVEFVSLASMPISFHGGTLIAQPFDYGPFLHVTNGAGDITLEFGMPSGVPPGTEIWVQWAIVDAAAVQGVALSNAVKGVTP